MKLLAHFSTAAATILFWSCPASSGPTTTAEAAKKLIQDEDGECNDAGQLLEVLVGLKTRIDHHELFRIYTSYSSPSLKDHERKQLHEDKIAIQRKAIAHVEPCLESFRSAIEDHNNNGGGQVDGLLELVPVSKDGRRFRLTGTARDFASFLDKRPRNDGEDNGESEKNGRFQISKATHKFPESLEECIGLVGAFRRNDDRNDGIIANNKTRLLKPAYQTTVEANGTCVTPNSFFSDYVEKFPLFGPFLQADAATIRNIYGVPAVEGDCYNPRISAVFQYNQQISPDDLACYAQINDLPESTVEFMVPSDKQNSDNGRCSLPLCICPPLWLSQYYSSKGPTCAEGNLDVMMLAGMSGGSKIMSFSYFNENEKTSEALMESYGK